jgi:hypothetical protein
VMREDNGDLEGINSGGRSAARRDEARREGGGGRGGTKEIGDFSGRAARWRGEWETG